jgi:hypothetical protein
MFLVVITGRRKDQTMETKETDNFSQVIASPTDIVYRNVTLKTEELENALLDARRTRARAQLKHTLANFLRR